MNTEAVAAPEVEAISSTLRSSPSSWPSSPSSRFRFGDFENEIDVTKQPPALRVVAQEKISGDSNRAYQRAHSQKMEPGRDLPGPFGRKAYQSGKVGRAAHMTPPHKAARRSTGSPDPGKRPDLVGGSARLGFSGSVNSEPEIGEAATWSAEARSFYKIGSVQIEAR